MYRPLHHSLTIGPSKIEGLGILAIDDIEKGTSLGISHIFDTRVEDNWIRTPLGGFLNHSEFPNCKYKYVDREIKALVTDKDIMPEEELTVKYTLYEVLTR